MSFLDNIREWVWDIVNHHDDWVEVTVKKGDRLWDMCEEASGATTDAEVQRHVGAVVELNPGIDPDRLQIGQKIKLPRDWAK